MFSDDVDTHATALRESITGARLLVIGAAGSIGSAFVRHISAYRPAGLHLVDIAENGLAETVRDLRSSPSNVPDDFATSVIDFGSIAFDRYLDAQKPFDWVVNFAALKHVRSERDPYSIVRMISVNVEALTALQNHRRCPGRVFSVSTDKAIRPANIMGATKNLMEQALFGHDAWSASSARFANVAFSAGSLLESFCNRLARRQPIAAPTGIRRYFMSQEEAGQLCAIATFLGEHRSVFFPKLDRRKDLRSLTDMAATFLAHYGLEPLVCTSEDEAKAKLGTAHGKWPCYFSPADTSGEKEEEEFFRASDVVDRKRFATTNLVIEPRPDPAVLERFLQDMDAIRRSPVWSKAEIAAAVRRAVPDLKHHETGLNLDQKM